MLGSVVRDQLFGPGTDPTGATIRIKNQPFRVVGVLTSKGQAAMGPDQDDTVIVPYTTVQKKLLGITHLQNITLSTADGVPFAWMRAICAASRRAAASRKCPEPHAGSTIERLSSAATEFPGCFEIVSAITGSSALSSSTCTRLSGV